MNKAYQIDRNMYIDSAIQSHQVHIFVKLINVPVHFLKHKAARLSDKGAILGTR